MKILMLSSTAAVASIVGALLLARWILAAFERLHESSARLAAGDLGARAPQEGARESLPSSVPRSTRWPRRSSSCSTLVASWLPGLRTICARRSHRSTRCSRRSRTDSCLSTSTCPLTRPGARVEPLCRRPVRAGANRRRSIDVRFPGHTARHRDCRLPARFRRAGACAAGQPRSTVERAVAIRALRAGQGRARAA